MARASIKLAHHRELLKAKSQKVQNRIRIEELRQHNRQLDAKINDMKGPKKPTPSV